MGRSGSPPSKSPRRIPRIPRPVGLRRAVPLAAPTAGPNDTERAVSRHGTLVVPLVTAFAAAGAAASLLTSLGLGMLRHATIPEAQAIMWAVVSGALTGLFGLWLGQRSKAALRPISRAAAVWKAGGLRYRIPPLGDDELGDLASSLNALADHHETEVRALRRLADERASLSRDAARAAVLEERQRLARELHDAVSQAVFSIAMMSAAVRRLLPDRPDEAARGLEEVARTAQLAQREMRALLLELRPVELSGRALTDGLRAFLGEVRARHAIETSLRVTGDPTLPTAVEDGLFRIAQEAVANSVRHADARRIDVELEVEARRIRLVVTDDGRGFDPSRAAADGHYGLASMQERCAELGGRLRIESRHAEDGTPGGTVLWVEVPLDGSYRAPPAASSAGPSPVQNASRGDADNHG